MTEQDTRLGFRQVDLPDWHWMLRALHARFDTGSFAAGAAFVAAVGQLALANDHPPRVDLRADYVGCALHSPDVDGVTARDVRLAESISALAVEHRLTPRPERVQVLELALDTPAPDDVRPFWAALLGVEDTGDDVVDPAGRIPSVWFQRTDSDAPDRQRFHLDVTVPPDVARDRIDAAIRHGGHVVDAEFAPAYVVLSDADGNKACVCTELGRD